VYIYTEPTKGHFAMQVFGHQTSALDPNCLVIVDRNHVYGSYEDPGLYYRQSPDPKNGGFVRTNGRSFLSGLDLACPQISKICPSCWIRLAFGQNLSGSADLALPAGKTWSRYMCKRAQ